MNDTLGNVTIDLALIEAPALIDAEIVSAFRRLYLSGDLDGHEATAAIGAWQRVPVRRHPLPRLTTRAWDLRHAITSSDAYYVALAEALGIPLVTTDRRLARAAEPYCDVIIPNHDVIT